MKRAYLILSGLALIAVLAMINRGQAQSSPPQDVAVQWEYGRLVIWDVVMDEPGALCSKAQWDAAGKQITVKSPIAIGNLMNPASMFDPTRAGFTAGAVNSLYAALGGHGKPNDILPVMDLLGARGWECIDCQQFQSKGETYRTDYLFKRAR